MGHQFVHNHVHIFQVSGTKLLPSCFVLQKNYKTRSQQMCRLVFTNWCQYVSLKYLHALNYNLIRIYSPSFSTKKRLDVWVRYLFILINSCLADKYAQYSGSHRQDYLLLWFNNRKNSPLFGMYNVLCGRAMNLGVVTLNWLLQVRLISVQGWQMIFSESETCMYVEALTKPNKIKWSVKFVERK